MLCNLFNCSKEIQWGTQKHQRKSLNDHRLVANNEVLLAYANMTKNMMLDVNGVSTFQRVYWTTPAFNIINQEEFPKCLDNASTKDFHELKTNLNTIQAVREAFAKAENEEKLKGKKPNVTFK